MRKYHPSKNDDKRQPQIDNAKICIFIDNLLQQSCCFESRNHITKLQIPAIALIFISYYLYPTCIDVSSIPACDLCIWVRSRNCGCLVTWFCYLLIAKPGNKTAPVLWPDPYYVKPNFVISHSPVPMVHWMVKNHYNLYHRDTGMVLWKRSLKNPFAIG